MFGALADGTGIDDDILCSTPALGLGPASSLVVTGDTLAITFVALTPEGMDKVFARHDNVLALIDTNKAATQDFVKA